MGRRVGVMVAAAAVAGLVGLAGCGGGDGGSGAAKDKGSWDKKNGSLIAAFSRDLDDAINNINQGARDKTTGSCTQVSEDGKEVKKSALPVPDAASNTALTQAVDQGIQAADNCLKGAALRDTGARTVEEAQRNFAAARKSMDEAEAAIKAWK